MWIDASESICSSLSGNRYKNFFSKFLDHLEEKWHNTTCRSFTLELHLPIYPPGEYRARVWLINLYV